MWTTDLRANLFASYICNLKRKLLKIDNRHTIFHKKRCFENKDIIVKNECIESFQDKAK